MKSSDEPVDNDVQRSSDLEIAATKFDVAIKLANASKFDHPRQAIDNLVTAINFMMTAKKKYLSVASHQPGSLAALDYQRCAAQCLLEASAYSSRIATLLLVIEIDQSVAISEAINFGHQAGKLNKAAYSLLVQCKRECDAHTQATTPANDS